MKSELLETSKVWFAEIFSLPPVYCTSDSTSMLILIDKKSLQICGFSLLVYGKRTKSLTLLELITQASCNFPAPDVILTSFVPKTSLVLFDPDPRSIRFLPFHYASPKDRGRIELLLRDLQCYLDEYARVDDLPFSPNLNSAMEGFSFDYPIYLSSMLHTKEDASYATT